MALYQNCKIVQNRGLICVLLVRRVRQDTDNIDVDIQKSVQELTLDLNEIAKARAESLGANLISSYKVEISKVQRKEQPDGSINLFILIEACGDAFHVTFEHE